MLDYRDYPSASEEDVRTVCESISSELLAHDVILLARSLHTTPPELLDILRPLLDELSCKVVIETNKKGKAQIKKVLEEAETYNQLTEPWKII